MPYAPEAVVGDWTIEPRRSSVFARLGEMWQYRHLLGYFATKTLQSLYRRSSLGWIWLLLRVMGPIGVNGAVFGGIAKMKPHDDSPYFLFLLCGQAAWTMFDRSLFYITRSMERNRKLISKVYFPRLILPVASASPSVLFLAIFAVVLTGVDVFMWWHTGTWYIEAAPRLLLAPVAVGLCLLFAIAVGFWTSVLQARYRDIRFAVRYAMPFLMFATSSLYPLEQMPAQYRWVVTLMPVETPIEWFRYATLGSPIELPVSVMAWHLVAIALTGIGGIWFFNREEAASVDKL